MLAQILQDLYVPQELLDGLTEDQKQILFCKMREEQVRRYHEREEEEEDESMRTSSVNLKKKNKQVTFQLDTDDNESCWNTEESYTSLRNVDTKASSSINNENLINDNPKHFRTRAGTNYSFSARSGSYFTAHRDDRKRIEEISNNIEEARRLFECLEAETERLILNKRAQVSKQKSLSPTRLDTIDERLHHEIQHRANKIDLEKRERAKRVRENFQRHSAQFDICFHTNNHATVRIQPSPSNAVKKMNEEKTEQNVANKCLVKNSSTDDCINITNKQEQVSHSVPKHHQTKPVAPLTREDIRHWFCISEVPYGTFRSPDGRIYPWFHGIISRSYAEQLLCSQPVGSYLIRVNEKIFGYALSYHASDHCRHLLIEVILSPKRCDDRKQLQSYRFLGGAKHEAFSQLSQLIEKYSHTPIRSNSTDVLRFPCGQINSQQPDYADLLIEYINNQKNESVYVSLETTTSPQSITHL